MAKYSLVCFILILYVLAAQAGQVPKNVSAAPDRSISSHSPLMLEKYELRIVDGLGTLVVTHCMSEKDDFGVHVLHPKDDIYWRFRMGFFKKTRVTCSVWAEAVGKGITLQLFNKDIAVKYCGDSSRRLNICYWVIRNDGFYLANSPHAPPSDFTKVYSW